MGELGAFLRLERVGFEKRDPEERVHDYRQYFQLPEDRTLRDQGARCMDCGIPFCHEGCPLGNLIPDWNDLVYRDRWRDALTQLHATNNFPEFTGLICPAPCESACVLDINDDPVTIEQIELAIVTRGFEEGWIVPDPPSRRSGRTVGVIGSGPAGLAAAAELNQHGHSVTVYERDEGPGGLMRFGVPDFKLEKRIIDRRVEVLEQEGVEFRYDADVGGNVDGAEIARTTDAIVVATGARVPRELPIPGRELDGVHFAMDYLYDRNRWVAAQDGGPDRTRPDAICARDKHVVVIGGGDTAMDCVGNAHREGARTVTVIDTYEPPAGAHTREIVPWPEAPKRLQSTYALDEGGERLWQRTAVELVGADGRVAAVRGAQAGPSPAYAPVEGTGFELPADLVLIAIGFSGVERDGATSQLDLLLDGRGNIR